jgi:hypothetical protein
LKYFFLIILIFLGCNNYHTKNSNNLQKSKTKITKKTLESNITVIRLNDINLTFKNQKLLYPKEKTYLLFYNKSNYSKMQEDVLNYLKIKYIKTDNKFLQNYFKIKIYPTTVILDKNKTVKLENFTPVEILKGF